MTRNVVSLRRIIYLFSFACLIFIFFYKLDLHPRPWHDEGAALTLAKTLFQDGIYAIKNSDGYQTFGAVQSAGPTVILPISLVFRFFGVGLVQGRWIGAFFSIVALIAIFIISRRLYNEWVGWICILIIISAPVIEYIYFGRQAGADTAGLAFFLISAIALNKGDQSRKLTHYLLCGICLGLAIISKSQYLLFGIGALSIVLLVDLFYYRSGAALNILISLFIAVSIYLAWQGWQRYYYGESIFLENMEKLRALSSAVYGIHPSRIISVIKTIITTGALYIWGLVSWLSQIPNIVFQTNKSKTILYLWSFFIIWFLYIVFWAAPHSQIPLMGASIMAIFIANILYDILFTVIGYISEQRHRNQINQLLLIGCIIALLTFLIPLGYGLLNRISDYVVNGQYDSTSTTQNPDSWVPMDLITYLNENIQADSIIETWERELGILTNHTYHYPDQAIRTNFYLSDLMGDRNLDQLGDQYFLDVKADYLIIGTYARYFNTYDLNSEDLEYIASFSVYDIYQISEQ